MLDGFANVSEVDEITSGKNVHQLWIEYYFQLKMGESEGGTICSEIVEKINVLQANLTEM